MRTFFACECSGCRGYRVQFEDMRYQTARAISHLEGFYFAPETMRFFGCKITHFYPLKSRGAVFFTTNKAGFEHSDGKERVWVVYCPYGKLLDDLKTELRPKVTAKSLKEFEEIRINGGFDELVKHCVCHGCKIDRQGLREIEDAEICIDCPTHCGGN
jgi:hypothetical protein